MSKIMYIIFGMSLVTYLPRVIPAIFIKNMKWSDRAERFLKWIPYTAMGALIFPGILSVDKGMSQIGIVGGIVALVLSWCKLDTTLVIIGSVGAVMLTYLL